MIKIPRVCQLCHSVSSPVHQDVLNDAYESMTRYNKAVTRATGILIAREAIIASHRIDLADPEESLEISHWKQEEWQSTIADIQDLTEKLGIVSSPEAKQQLQCSVHGLVLKDSAVREAAKIKEAEIEG